MKKEKITAISGFRESIPWEFFISAITTYGEMAFPVSEDYFVEFKVNGIKLPFKEVIEDWYKRASDDIEKKAAKRAVEICTVAGFDDLRETLENARWKIEQKIEEVTGVRIERD